MENHALITNDAIVLGLLMAILMIIFRTSASKKPVFVKFYKYVPALLLCYFVPSIFNSLGVIMFFAGTVGIILGGPIAILLTSMVAPEVVGGVGPDEVWRGMATIAGSWIGGGANQAAMYEVFKPSDDLYSTSIAVDVIIANIWMAFLLYGAARSARVDKLFKADASSIEEVKHNVETYRASIARMPTLTDTITVLAVGFIATAIGHAVAGVIAPFLEENYPILKDYSLTSPFFWMVITATLVGFALSYTKAKQLEGVGASRIGSVMIYFLVATTF